MLAEVPHCRRNLTTSTACMCAHHEACGRPLRCHAVGAVGGRSRGKHRAASVPRHGAPSVRHSHAPRSLNKPTSRRIICAADPPWPRGLGPSPRRGGGAATRYVSTGFRSVGQRAVSSTTNAAAGAESTSNAAGRPSVAVGEFGPTAARGSCRGATEGCVGRTAGCCVPCRGDRRQRACGRADTTGKSRQAEQAWHQSDAVNSCAVGGAVPVHPPLIK